MAKPTPYDRKHQNTVHEFPDIERTLDETLSALELIQRDDGKLRNESVHMDALSREVLAMFSAVDPAKIRGAWATSTAYAKGDVVTNSGATYVAAVAHTGGAFATDLAAAKWMPISGDATLVQTNLTTLTNNLAAAAGSSLLGFRNSGSVRINHAYA